MASRVQEGFKFQDGALVVSGSGGGGGAPSTATYLTATDQVASLPNSRRLVNGAGIAFDDTTPGVRTVSATGGGGGFTPMSARVGRYLSNQPAAGGGVYTFLEADTVQHDSGNFFNPATPDRFVIPVDGIYMVTGGIFQDPGQDRDLYLRVNDTYNAGAVQYQNVVYSLAIYSGMPVLNAGDYIQLGVFAATLDLIASQEYNNFCISLVEAF